jgi:transcriptional regulator with XRE-family HTH domain
MDMAKHDDTVSNVSVLDGQQRARMTERVLEMYDATADVGLSTIVYNAAIERRDEDGEETIEIPKPTELRAAAAIIRCLIPIKLRASELKAIRKILGLTMAEMAKKLDERTAVETVSRWESDTQPQPMGGYAEKMFRLLVCEELKVRAPGVDYNGKMIADLRVIDPWIIDQEFKLPPLEIRLIEMMRDHSGIIEVYNNRKAA